MQNALECISKKLVSAKKALRQTRYICPECLASVVLRAGHQRPAYFAHASGKSDADCARYAASYGNSNVHGLADASHDSVEALQLKLRIKRRDSEYAWSLDIVVPTYRVNYGSILIDTGGRTNEINLEGNLSPYRIISAVPQGSPYKIIEITPTDSRLAELDKICNALDHRVATVFGHFNRTEETGIARARVLQPERTYVFIWHCSHSPAFPEELTVEPLASRQEWCGALVDIPYLPSSQCSFWLEQFSSLELVKAAPAIIPVWPPLLRSLTTQRVEAPPQHSLKFFIEHSQGTFPQPVFARSMQDDRVAKADFQNLPLYELSPEGAKYVQLTCTNGPHLGIDFRLQASQLISVQSNVVKLLGIDKSGNTVETVLHSSESLDWLSQIRSGELDFKCMTLPECAKGHVKVRRNAEWFSELEFCGDSLSHISLDSVISTNADLANQLVKMLLDPTLSVMIDFSSFGRAVIYGAVCTTDETRPSISNSILRRIRQYFIQFPDGSPLNGGRSNFSDKQLLIEFEKLKPTKKSLAHYRYIQNNIPRENSR